MRTIKRGMEVGEGGEEGGDWEGGEEGVEEGEGGEVKGVRESRWTTKVWQLPKDRTL